MRRIRYRAFGLLFVFFLTLLTLPERATERMRLFAVSSLAPTWGGLHFLKNACLQLLMVPLPSRGEVKGNPQEEALLREENLLLRAQLENVREWLLDEERVEEQMQRYRLLAQKQEDQNQEQDAPSREFYKRRGRHLATILDLQLHSLSAKVVFREPASWGSFVWLNGGEKDNRALKRKIVAKNSPVVMGSSIVGVVEEVGESLCKVRLLSDPALAVSVRAVRGKEQNHFLLEHLESLMLAVGLREDLPEKEEIFKMLLPLKTKLNSFSEESYLAKGELSGASSPLFRSRRQRLKGVGFNYDFADEEGAARDLRTPGLLKGGDLLVTTGMDGVFPPGFRVAVVSHVVPLKEGACSYEIEAIATAGNFDELKTLTILPPL